MASNPRLPRFFSAKQITTDEIELAGPEQHHLAHVMRLGSGARVCLFDGSGWEFEAEVIEVTRNLVRLTVHQHRDVDRELPFELILGAALPKGDRQQWLIEKTVELGVTKLVPLHTERGVAQPRDNALQRLGRWVVGAAKQCGRNRLMQIAPPESITRFAARADDGPVLAAHPDTTSSPLRTVVKGLPEGPMPICLAVGPEGGFTEQEITAIREAGCHLVSLGERILRVETAAVSMAACVAYTRA